MNKINQDMRKSIITKSSLKLRFLYFLFLLATIPNGLMGQTQDVVGKVIRMSNSEPLEDITIKVLGENIAPVVTDSLGVFKIQVPDLNAILQASYTGFKTQTLFLNQKSDVTFKLIEEGDYWIEDKISIPYGSVSDKDYTGSRSYLDEKLLGLEKNSSIEDGIKGVAAGVRNITYSGAPGSGSALLIHGISTIKGGTQPLYILDGLVLRNYQFKNPLAGNAYHNPMVDINANDIKSITILKDGASASLYGVRGTNGIILIETNKGTSGKTSLTMDIYSGVSTKLKSFDLLDKSHYKSYFKDLNYLSGMTPYEFGRQYGRYFYEDIDAPDYFRFNNNTNWQDEVTQTAIQQSYYFNLKGGDQVTTYAFSSGYLSEQGVVKGTDLQRFTIDFNLVYRISERVRFGNVVNFSYVHKNLMDEGINEYSNPLYISLLKAPMTAPNIFSSEGLELDSHEDQDFFGLSNPAHIITDLKNEAKFNRLLGNLFLEFDLAKNLSGRISMGIDFNRQNEKRFYPDYGLAIASNAKRFSASKINSRFMQQADALVNYKTYFNRIHKLDVVVGGGLQNSQLDYTYGKSINSAADYFTTLSTGKADSVASNNLVSKLVSVYARGNYAFKDKYLANLNLRVDGSSRFGSNHAYGIFYGLSGAWRISQEDFIKDNSKINELKLKLGYGISGNENIEDYAAYNLYGGAAYNLRGATKPISLGNKDLKWEQTGQFDIGMQFLGYKTRLGIDFDLYLKQTKDLYYIKELPSITGYSGILSNLGKMNNKGADISVFARITDSKLRWDSRVNLGVYKNKIIELNKDYTESYYGTYGLAREGEATGLIYGYKMLGIYDTNAEAQSLTNGLGYAPFEAGDVQFEDKNGDGTIDNNDLQVIGNPHPDFFGGFINSFNIGNWFLDINLTYSVGNDAFNTTRMGIEGMYNHFNQSTAVLKAWRKQGDANITNIPRIAQGDPAGNSRSSSRWVEDASYLKIQSVGLSYVLPNPALKKLHLQNAQIYLKGMNLYTFSNYLGYTPDFISGSNPLGYGIDQGAYPLARTIILGVKIGL